MSDELMIEAVQKLGECYDCIAGEWGEDAAEDIMVLIRKIREKHPVTMAELASRMTPEEIEKRAEQLDAAFGFGRRPR